MRQKQIYNIAPQVIPLAMLLALLTGLRQTDLLRHYKREPYRVTPLDNPVGAALFNHLQRLPIRNRQ